MRSADPAREERIASDFFLVGPMEQENVQYIVEKTLSFTLWQT